MLRADTIDRLGPGDHACVVFDDDESRGRALTALVRAGVRDGHRILWFGDFEPEIDAGLPDRLRPGQLRTATYVAGGVFDPEAAIDTWREESARARAAGYRGLRAAGDMSWASGPVPGADRVCWFEAQVNRFFAEGFAMAVCLYDRRLFSRAELTRVCWSHPATIGYDTDPSAVPLLRAVRTDDPPGIALHGEADLSNRRALRTLVEHMADDSPAADGPLTVDLSGLRFADAAAIRILARAAASSAHRLRLVGPSRAIRRLLSRFGSAEAIR